MVEHGVFSTYNNKRCRCEPCKGAFSRVWLVRKAAYEKGEIPDRCQSCGEEEKLFWDHHHASETHRGWLCRGCNSLIGYFREDKELLMRAIQYLERGSRATWD